MLEVIHVFFLQKLPIMSASIFLILNNCVFTRLQNSNKSTHIILVLMHLDKWSFSPQLLLNCWQLCIKYLLTSDCEISVLSNYDVLPDVKYASSNFARPSFSKFTSFVSSVFSMLNVNCILYTVCQVTNQQTYWNNTCEKLNLNM